MAKVRTYTDDEKQIALAFYAVTRDVTVAAKKSKVDEKTLTFWIAGGDEKKAIAATEGITLGVGDTKPPRPDEDLSRFDFNGDGDPYILAERAAYEARRLELLLNDGRPMPPVHLSDPLRTPTLVTPDLDLETWVRKTFIGDEDGTDGPIVNEEHAHLRGTSIGFLWTNVENQRRGMRVVGTAELVASIGDRWQTAEYHYHLARWFGEVPTFLIRLDSVYCAEADAASFAALVEHELYHCGVKMDADGNIKIDRFGNFQYASRGHDIEQFVGVVRRYGARAAGVERLIQAASRRPEISEAQIEAVCCGCGSAIA